MISWFKKHFIPHTGNNNRPHFLQKKSVRNVVLLILFLETFTFLIPTLTRINITGGMAAVLPAILSILTNNERQSQNLQTLNINPILNKAAEMKALDMATKGYFAHTSPEGKTPWYWLEQVGYKYQYAGENLAINFSDSKDVADAWMASPTHKANIVKKNYTEVGTGIATGVYEGRETVFVAQVYANPILEETSKNLFPKTETKNTEETSKITTTKEISDVLGAETVVINKNILINQTQNPTFWQRLFASPRNTTNSLMYVILGVIFFALLAYILIKAKNHHVDLITNGLILLAVIGAILSVNYYLSQRNVIIAPSFDYSSVNK